MRSCWLQLTYAHVSTHTNIYMQVYNLLEGWFLKYLTCDTYWCQLEPSVYHCYYEIPLPSCFRENIFLLVSYRIQVLFNFDFFLTYWRGKSLLYSIPHCIWRFGFDIVIEWKNTNWKKSPTKDRIIGAGVSLGSPCVVFKGCRSVLT